MTHLYQLDKLKSQIKRVFFVHNNAVNNKENERPQSSYHTEGERSACLEWSSSVNSSQVQS